MNPLRRSGADLWVGGVAGGLVGFLTYWIGTALMMAPAFMRDPKEITLWFLLQPFTTFTVWELILVTTSICLGLLLARYRWRPFALAGYMGMWSLTIGYVVYALTVSIPRVPDHGRWLSYALFAAETTGLVLILIFSFYSLDAPARQRWSRRSGDRPWDPDLRPGVALVVPVYNEPVAMLEETIRRLVKQDYPADQLFVYVADDSTDPRAIREIADACTRLGAVHVRRADRTGFKAGALNHAVRKLPRTVEFVGVVDADYWAEPEFLRSTIGYFVDPDLSFVQTPQDYRNSDESFLTRRYQLAESYFYHTIMPSRNEENAIIFCGTMGILRRKALMHVGGFAEDQICEDADIGPRLAAKGWTSLYVDTSYGKGLMPSTFETYKQQFHRWAYGSVRILYAQAGLILRSRMRWRQKFDFLGSSLHWFDGLPLLVIALVLLTLGIAPLVGFDISTQHQHEMSLIALVPTFLFIDGMLRLRGVLNRRGPTGFLQALLVQGLWFSIKLTNLSAALKATLGLPERFVRTSKTTGHRKGRLGALGRSLRAAPVETAIGFSLLVVGFLNIPFLAPKITMALVLLPIWLALYGLFFLCAPVYAYLSWRTLEEKPKGSATPTPAVRAPVSSATQ